MVLVDVDITASGQDGAVTKTSEKNPASTNSSFFPNYTGTQINLSDEINRFQYPNTITPTGIGTTRQEARPFFMFSGVTIPLNSVILDATLTFFYQSQGETFTGKVYGRKTSSPQTYATPATGTGVFTKPNATAVGTWTVSGSPTSVTFTQKQSDITATVQELVNTFDYNNDIMMFTVTGATLTLPPVTTTPTAYASFQGSMRAYEAGGVTIPNLTVNYTDPAGQKSVLVDAILIFKKQEFIIDALLSPIAEFTISAQLDGKHKFLRPIADIAKGDFTDILLGNNDGDLWDEMDEINFDDIASAISGTISTQPEFRLTSCPDPNASFGHVIRIRHRTPIGNTPGSRLRLVQGASSIALFEFTSTSEWKTFEFTLTEAQANSITDYSDLRIRLEQT